MQENSLVYLFENMNGNCLVIENEKNFNQTRKLICVVKKICGYLWQLRFLSACFIEALYSDRTVIFKDLDPKTTDRNSSFIKFGRLWSI